MPFVSFTMQRGMNANQDASRPSSGKDAVAPGGIRLENLQGCKKTKKGFPGGRSNKKGGGKRSRPRFKTFLAHLDSYAAVLACIYGLFCLTGVLIFNKMIAGTQYLPNVADAIHGKAAVALVALASLLVTCVSYVLIARAYRVLDRIGCARSEDGGKSSHVRDLG